MDYKELLEKIKPFIAITIMIFIVLSTIQLMNYNKLQKEIKDNCGYERSEKVFCVCDKNLVSQIPIEGNPYYDKEAENLIGNINFSLD